MKKHVFIILFAICCLASGGIFVRISQTGPVMTGAYRSILAIPFLFVALMLEKTDKTIRYRMKMNTNDFIKCMLAGLFLALDLCCWNISFMYTTLAESNLLANLVPFIIAPISYFILKEKVSSKIIIPGCGALFGLYFLMLYGKNISISHTHGNFLALLTAFFYAMFLLTSKNLRDRYSATLIMIYVSLSCFVILSMVAFARHEVLIPRSYEGVVILLVLAVTSQIGGQTLLAYSIKYVPLKLSTIFILLQPVIATLYAWLIFRESLAWNQVVGGIIIMISIFYAKLILEKQS